VGTVGRRLTLEVTCCKLVLSAALGELFLVVEQVGFVHRHPALAPLGLTAGFDDPAGLALLTGPMRGRDLDSLWPRLGVLACTQRDPKHRDPAQ
jgi:hypothetical protein